MAQPSILIMQAVRKSLERHDEAVMNNRFPIYGYYRIAMLCAQYTGDKIDVYTPASHYHSHLLARKEGNKTKIFKYVGLLKQDMRQTDEVIKRFMDLYKNISSTQEERPDLYDKHACGCLAHEILD